jgi:hypothetical protein
MDIECYFVIGQMLFGAAVVADDDGNRSADERAICDQAVPGWW